jgi:hypothetical protein
MACGLANQLTSSSYHTPCPSESSLQLNSFSGVGEHRLMARTRRQILPAQLGEGRTSREAERQIDIR